MIQKEIAIIPIEVKSGTNIRSQSLKAYYFIIRGENIDEQNIDERGTSKKIFKGWNDLLWGNCNYKH